MNALKLVAKLVLGVLFIPLAIGVSVAFFEVTSRIRELSGNLNYFFWGIASYVIVHILFYKPTFLYVLGHEAVHAGIAWLFGKKVTSFKVTKDGGSVTTDKSNTMIELSPYFVPIYAIIVTLIYFVVVSSYNIHSSVFVFLIGFFLALHMISTIEVLKIRQPDFVKSGYFFSIAFVYILNIIVISFIFSLVFPTFSFQDFFLRAYAISLTAYSAIVQKIFF